MSYEFHKALFIFRRDLRLNDNTGLNLARAAARTVATAFIFDPRQVEENKYRSDNGLRFMLTSLEELSEALKEREGKLQVFFGDPLEVVGSLLEREGFEAVFVNTDYTPFSRKRDGALRKVCEEHGKEFRAFHDALLVAPEDGLKSDGTPYTVFTPFWKNARKYPVMKPKRLARGEFLKGTPPGADLSNLDRVRPEPNPNLLLKGGRAEGERLLKQLPNLKSYKEERDYPALKSTSLLSAHHKFGTVSIRETYWATHAAFGENSTLIQELYWRDFFSHVTFHFPHVFKGAFRKEFDEIEWENDRSKFNAWCEGRTGFPMVDAGMRELVATGYMHNRVRMIVASFLTKDLHIDWRWGERFFAKHLVDYDPAVNNGNWQWAASTGCDAQPYFRIFNPWLQQQRFDPEADYIRQWVSELSECDSKTIHGLSKGGGVPTYGYPTPIVDHQAAKGVAQELFTAAKEERK